MAETRLTIDPQSVETNCSKKLSAFVTLFNKHANSLKQHVSELRKIANNLTAKSQQIIKLENIKFNELKCYSVEERDMVVAAALHQANYEVQSARKFISLLNDFHTELNSEYKKLMSAANALKMLCDTSQIITGNSKQKPIKFYIDEACALLHDWLLHNKALTNELESLDIRNTEPNQQFGKMLASSSTLIERLDNYLLFSNFLVIQK